MDNENKTTVTTDPTDISAAEAVAASPKKEAVRDTKKKSRVWDNLLSSLLLLLLLCLSGVLYYLIVQSAMEGALVGNIINYCLYGVYILVGLGIFFATRTGDGKNVYRVNWFSIIFVLLPIALLTLGVVLINEYVLRSGFYFNAVSWIMENGTIVLQMGLIVFGYALPYSFISGFERHVEEKPAEAVETAALETNVTAETVAETAETVETESDGSGENTKPVEMAAEDAPAPEASSNPAESE